MLRELHISSLALIEDLSVTLTEGLNVFTGQTGAGKSLVMGAFELLLGLRSTAGAAELVRPGADEARISGLFEVHDAACAMELSGLADQPVAAGDALLMTRKLFASGRTSVSINGQPATAAMARAIGQRLVDVHGQHDHQFLLRPANQMAVLDDYAGCAGAREDYARCWVRLRGLRQSKLASEASRTLRQQQLELSMFQAREIDDAQPTVGEFAELDARHRVLANLARLQRDAGMAHAALYEADGSVSERLQMIAMLLVELGEIDEQLEPVAEQVRGAALAVQEAAYDLARYSERLEHDPGEAAEVQQRLDVLNRLIHKYGEPRKWSIEVPDEPLPEDGLDRVLVYRDLVGRQIARLQAEDEQLDQVDGQIAAAKRQLRLLGASLTEARRKAAASLRPLVEAQLAELGMAEARFEVAVEPAEPGPGGADAVEMMVRTNPGQAFQPLRRIASGGEMSRIMLAIKSILADADRVSVLVFDEIDANIGGRLGSVIGRKLRELAGGPGPGHQVLCITHLPQIAAFGDRHFRIAKSVTGSGSRKQTRTEITVLDGRPRVDELAEMMAGRQVTATSRKQARELIEAAGQ